MVLIYSAQLVNFARVSRGPNHIFGAIFSGSESDVCVCKPYLECAVRAVCKALQLQYP